MKKNKVAHYTKQVQVYKFPISYTNSREEYNRITSSQGERPVNCSGATFLDYLEDGTPLFLFGVFDGQLTTYVHECFHMTMFVARHLGLDVDEMTCSEHLAYLNEHIFELFYSEFRSSQA